MSAEETDRIFRMLAVRNVAIDRLAAEIATAFAAAGIETLVLKGPVLAAWLYPGEIRPYGDADLMVAPRDWEAAVAILERLGFADHLGPLAHPRMESFASTAFLRGEDNLDLHCVLHGLDGAPERVWAALLEGAERQLDRRRRAAGSGPPGAGASRRPARRPSRRGQADRGPAPGARRRRREHLAPGAGAGRAPRRTPDLRQRHAAAARGGRAGPPARRRGRGALGPARAPLRGRPHRRGTRRPAAAGADERASAC